jgi:hypothetical protein
MAVRLGAKLPKDSQVKLSFSLPEANISLEVEGQIAWSDQSGRAGIRFVSVPQSMQYQLEKWLTDRLQEEMPQQLHGYVVLP